MSWPPAPWFVSRTSNARWAASPATSALIAGPCPCVECEPCGCELACAASAPCCWSRRGDVPAISSLPFREIDWRRHCWNDQREKHVIDLASRQRTPALDPPVQHENERRDDVFRCEVCRQRGAPSVGALHRPVDLIPNLVAQN